MKNSATRAARTARAIAPRFAVDHATEGVQLWTNWISLWNGDYHLASEIVAPKFTLHASLLGGQDPANFNSPATLVSLIEQIRTAIPDLIFTVKVGPIMDGSHIAGHWNAAGHYAGLFSGAAAEVGTQVSFNGTDILRIEDRKVAEYWLVSDNLSLVNQLGIKI